MGHPNKDLVITQGHWFIINHRGKSTLFWTGGAGRFPRGEEEFAKRRSKRGKMEG